MSSLSTRPPLPVPSTSEMSTPSSRDRCCTAGVASAAAALGWAAARLGRVALAVDVNFDKRLAHPRHLARLVVQLLDGTGEAARDLDRRLVALHLAQRREFLDARPGLDEPLYHLALDDALANVGQQHRLHGPQPPRLAEPPRSPTPAAAPLGGNRGHGLPLPPQHAGASLEEHGAFTIGAAGDADNPQRRRGRERQ